MRKLIITIIALTAMHCHAWAQYITAKSDAEECLKHMGLIISRNDAFDQEYDFRGTRIVRTATSVDTTLVEHLIDVNWASYSGLTVEKGSGDLIITLNFDDTHVAYTGMYKKNRPFSRVLNRTNIFQFNFPPELSDEYLPEFRRGAERLRQLAKSNAEPLLRVDKSDGWLETIPTDEEYDTHMQQLANDMAPWSISIFDDPKGKAFAFVEYTNEKQGRAVWFDSDGILDIKYNDKGYVVSGMANYLASPDAMPDFLPEFTLPLAEAREGVDRSELLKYLKLYLWEQGVNILEGGFKVGR